MTQNDNKEVQYIWHDGVRIREDQLISMAINAGDYSLAEHYMCSLLAHGVINGLVYMIDKANEIREHYHVCTIPVPHKDATPGSSYGTSIEEQVRKKYRCMTTEERVELIKDSLGRMMANYPKLFFRKKQWQGIYLVIRDRLDGSLNRTKFVSFIDDATPSGWPERLKVTEGSIRNMSRDFQCTDFDLLTYYELEYNPYEELCETFWGVIKELIMG